MGCLILRDNFLEEIQANIGGNMKSLFYFEKRRFEVVEQCAIFQKKLAPGVCIFGTISPGIDTIMNLFRDNIESLIKNNIYFKLGEYVDGFQNFLECFICEIKNQYMVKDLLIKVQNESNSNDDYYDRNSSSIKVSFTCCMRVNDQLYSMQDHVVSKLNAEGLSTPKSSVFFQVGDSKQFIQQTLSSNSKQVSDYVMELNPDIAKNITCLLLTNAESKNKEFIADPRPLYPKKEFNSQRFCQLRVYYSKKHFQEFNYKQKTINTNSSPKASKCVSF